jgi:hypothetical protein
MKNLLDYPFFQWVTVNYVFLEWLAVTLVVILLLLFAF